MKIKKTLIVIIHALSVLAFAASIGILAKSAPEGRGLGWISQDRYEDSALFSDQFNADLAGVRRLTVLKDAFEDEGEFDLERNIIRAETEQGMIGKTLGTLLSDARKFGYILDSDNHRIRFVENENTDNTDYSLRVISKVYDPYFIERQAPGPSVGITTYKEVCLETIRAVQEYYLLKGLYETGKTNFFYSYHYLNGEGDYADLGNTSLTDEEIMGLGRYAALAERNGDIVTNISPVPVSILPDSTGSVLGDNSDYSFYAGVDTDYIYTDRYQNAAFSYEGNKKRIYGYLTVLAVSFIIAAVTLIIIVDDRTDADTAHPSDSMLIEIFGIMWIAFAAVLYLFICNTLCDMLDIVIPQGDVPFWKRAVKDLCIYLAGVNILSSVLRRYRKGTLYSGSILGRFAEISGNDENGAFATTFRSLGILIIIDAVLCVFVTVLYLRKRETQLPAFPLIALALVFAAVNCYAFIKVYGRRVERQKLSDALKRISEGETGLAVTESEYSGIQLSMARSINNISVGLGSALNEQVKAERLKADLITNVSHDIRTPLTSIINYVDLLKREDIKDEKLREYIDVLDRKSFRLKNLTEDLLEASKASSGNVRLEMNKLDLRELAKQAGAEFEDRYAKRNLTIEISTPEEPVYVLADGRHLWRVFDNLYNNAGKYSMENTRVYVDVIRGDETNSFVIKNISAQKLNISPEELTERFVRGDVSRSTEGSGLGLSIAESLTKLMGGRLKIEIDGDLYKASVILPVYREEASDILRPEGEV